MGLLGGTVLGISCVAPAYTLTATIGLLVGEAGNKVPVIILAGFLPMFFAAYAYRELNRVAPDCGTSFTWTTKAFGPYVGWIGGWTAVLATVIVLSNLAGVAVQFIYQFVGDLVGSDYVAGLWENKLVNVVTCLAFLAVATYVAYRGITTTETVQFMLVGFQMAVLLIFAVMAIVESGDSPTGMTFSWDWFSPAGLTLSAFIAGLSGSIFAFWGWDTALTVNEESKDSETTPGRAALLSIVSILATYLLVSIATQMYAGVGDEGLGLANEEIADNVFGALAEPVMGNPLDLMLFLAVLASSAASLITTFLPTTRTMLAMGAYLPRAPSALRHDPPAPPDAVVRHGRSRPGAAVYFTRATDLQRERPDRHDLLDRHHDLLLLRADTRSPASGTSATSCSRTSTDRVQVPVPAARRHRAHRGSRGHPEGLRTPPTTAAGRASAASVWCSSSASA